MKLPAGSVESFFCKYNPDIKNSVIVVDEAAAEEFFYLKFNKPSVIEFFAWHRHMGIDVALLVQDVSSVVPFSS